MTEDYTFIDREGAVDKGKKSMTKGWISQMTKIFLTESNHKTIY